MTLEISSLAVLFLLNAYFSAAEISMAALSRAQVAELSEAHPAYRGLLDRFVAHPSRLLTTIILSSNLSVIAFSSVATLVAFSLSGAGVASIAGQALTMVLSVLSVLLAEIAPKILAKRHPRAMAVLVLPGLGLVEFLLGPLARFIVALLRWLTSPFGGADVTGMPMVTEEELVRLVDEGARGGVIEAEESEMIQSVLEFGDTVVREVMVPRTEMVGVPETASVEECLDLFIDGGYSRMPVYGESFDQIKGFLYAKDFLAVLKERELIILQDVIRPAYFVPETKQLSSLLREFKKGKIHVAIVVDEYGGTAGLVTMEDLVEEIIGEIKDEYDFDANLIRRLPDGSWEVDGAAELADFARELALEPVEEEGISTVAGLAAHLFGRIPVVGERTEFKGWRLEIERATETRVERVRLRKARP